MSSTSYPHWAVVAGSIMLVLAWYRFFRSYQRFTATVRTNIHQNVTLTVPIIFLVPIFNIPAQLRLAFKIHRILHGHPTIPNRKRNRFLVLALVFIICQCLALIPQLLIPASTLGIITFLLFRAEISSLGKALQQEQSIPNPSSCEPTQPT
ncbi:hypothetical protein [Pelodictyon luteolum]|nr:hypothetical protein [Pelodictyon luteolum]